MFWDSSLISDFLNSVEITSTLLFFSRYERNNLALENEKLRQQLELMKMCNKVNRNPTLKHNENFDLLVSKCRGIVPIEVEETRPAEKNTWKGMKKEYLEANPDAKTMDNTTLKMPPKDYILPPPKPKDD